MQQENHKLLRAFAMATNAPLEPIVIPVVRHCPHISDGQSHHSLLNPFMAATALED